MVHKENGGGKLLFRLPALPGEELIGLFCVRCERAQILGHIGCGLRSSQRKKGCGSRLPAEGLSICPRAGLSEVVPGCCKDNAGFASCIGKNGGRLSARRASCRKGRMSRCCLVKTVKGMCKNEGAFYLSGGLDAAGGI